MPARPRSKKPIPAPEAAEAMFHAEDGSYVGRTLPREAREEEQSRKNWTPGEQREIFRKNRTLAEDNSFVGEWCHVRRVFFDDGLRFTGEDEKLAKWIEDRGLRSLIQQLNADIWSEWLLQDNVVVFWITPAGKGMLPAPLVLDCEDCEYSNGLGRVLKIKVPKKKLSDEEKARLNDRWKTAYATGGWVTVDESANENFAVLTRAKAGKGFVKPRLRQAYPLLGTLDHLLASDFGGAFQARTIVQHIKVGREMKFQDALAKPEYFTISKAEKQQIERELRNKVGGFRAITDIKVAFEWAYMDPKFFDAEKYKGTLTQLDRWGGAGMMLLATGEDWLLPFFAAEGRSDRAAVSGLLNRLLADRRFLIARPSVPIRAEWNPNTFRDFKAVMDLLRFAVGQGVMSNTTAREYLALDDQREGDRLVKEAADKTGRYRPAFEPKQGLLSDERGGRPPKEEAQA